MQWHGKEAGHPSSAVHWEALVSAWASKSTYILAMETRYVHITYETSVRNEKPTYFCLIHGDTLSAFYVVNE